MSEVITEVNDLQTGIYNNFSNKSNSMHTAGNLFLIPVIGAIIGTVIAGPEGLVFGGLVGLFIGILQNRTKIERDQRIADLERRVNELENELEDE